MKHTIGFSCTQTSNGEKTVTQMEAEFNDLLKQPSFTVKCVDEICERDYYQAAKLTRAAVKRYDCRWDGVNKMFVCGSW